MCLFHIALSILALITPLLSLPFSEVEVLEQLRAIPDGWTQVDSQFTCTYSKTDPFAI